MSDELTTLFFSYGLYTNNKLKIQNLRSKYGLKWNSGKIKFDISYNELMNAFKVLKIDNHFISDENLKGRTGSVGIWESSSDSLKIMMFDKKSEDEHLPIVLVYKGVEGEFYKELISFCAKIGCEVGKIVQVEGGGFEEVFKKKLNIEIVEKLKSVEGSKEVMKEAFLNAISEYRNRGHVFSDTFVTGWQKLIDKYGYYAVDDLDEELEKRSGKLESESKELESKREDLKNENNEVIEENKTMKVEVSWIEDEYGNIFVPKKFKIKRKGAVV